MASQATPVALNRLLVRLDQNLSLPAEQSRLKGSQYERNRVGANIEHARAMLLSLEKQSATVRVQSQRQSIQADLQEKREWIKKLSTRLLEVSSASQDEDSLDEDDDEDTEDVLATYGPARTDVDAGLETGEPQATRLDETQQQELRSRKPPTTKLSANDNRAAASSTAREQLFAGRKEPYSAGGDEDIKQTEKMMSHNRTEQEALTNGLLGLAKALKESSLNFGASLEQEKEVLNRAEGNLDKNAQGMEAAEKKMGMLRKMSEGQGWWGRIKLYAFIFGLWVACFLVVFIGPKLRF